MGQGLPDYGTHHPVLAGAVLATTGPILELGCGHYSTPLLHQMGLVAERFLLTIETDSAWMQRFVDMASDLHEFRHLDPDAIELPLDRHWGVALVDLAPGEYRQTAVRLLAPHAQLIVVHDTETDYDVGADYKLEPVFESFKFRSDYRRYRPYTSVVSMFQAFPISECDRTWDPKTAE